MRAIRVRPHLTALAVAALALFGGAVGAGPSPTAGRAETAWTDPLLGISGLSLLPGVGSVPTYIVVHDAKTSGDPKPANPNDPPPPPSPRVSIVEVAPGRVVVTETSGVKIRAEAKPLARVVKVLARGSEPVVLERVDAWLRVRDDEGADGWVHERYLSTALTRTPLAWPVGSPGAEVPNDLEAVSAIPGMRGHAVLAESQGRLIHVAVEKAGATWSLAVVMPAPAALPRWGGKDYEKEGGEKPDGEAFTLTTVDRRLVALWAERGTRAAAATVFVAPFDVEKGVDVDELGAVSLRVPEPTGTDVRDVSDVTVDAHGRVWFAAADDEGNDGPFRSAIYRLGALRASKAGLVLDREAEPVEVRRVAEHKVEGLEIVGDGLFAYGSDDENKGAWLRVEGDEDRGARVPSGYDRELGGR